MTECRIRGNIVSSITENRAEPRRKRVFREISLSAEERSLFWQFVDKSGPCWLWTGHKVKGNKGIHYYGRFGPFAAHRVAYTLLKGPIPEGMTLDHLREPGLCTSTLCCNPDHLEPVTQSENTKRYRRSLPRICKRGHQMAPTGNCRECIAIKTREWNERNQEHLNAYRREWYAANRDKIRAQKRAAAERRRGAAA